MIIVAIVFLMIGFCAAAFYYNFLVEKPAIPNDIVNTKEDDKIIAIEEIKRKEIIRTAIRNITNGSFIYSRYSIDQLCDIVEKHSPTLNYNLLNIEHCTEENIKDALKYAVSMQDSIILLERLMDKRNIAYSDDGDIICYFGEDLPLKELTEEYADKVINVFLEDTENADK